MSALNLGDNCARQTPFHIIFTLGHHVFPKTHAEAVHKDAVPLVKTTKVLIPFLKEKKKGNSIFTFTLAASSRRESRGAKRCRHVLSNRYLLLRQQQVLVSIRTQKARVAVTLHQLVNVLLWDGGK